MSYIRCLSNPEGLYVVGLPNGTVELFYQHKSFTMPSYVFKGLIKRWGESFDQEDVKFRGGRIRCAPEKEWRFELSYKKWPEKILLYEVTLMYIYQCNSFRWKKKR